MANFTLNTASQNQIWSTQFASEYVRASTYLPFMSSNGDNIITVQNEFTNKKGEIIHVPVIGKLRGALNDGTTRLVGNEIAMNNYSVGFQTALKRQAVVVPITEQLKTELDLQKLVKTQLVKYGAEMLKNDLITSFYSIPVVNPTSGLEDLNVAYSAANASQLNAFCSNNSDRVTFVGGSNTGTMSTSLATVAATTGTLSAATLSAAKDQFDATTNSSTFALNPYETKDGNPWLVLFVNSAGYRQLRNDPEIFQSTKDALPRDSDADKNPLFTGGDLIWDGIVIKKNRDYGFQSGVGASNSNVAQAHLCGTNAVYMGYSMKTKSTILSEDDYQLYAGSGFMEHRGQIKGSVNGIQTGMVTIFHAW